MELIGSEVMHLRIFIAIGAQSADDDDDGDDDIYSAESSCALAISADLSERALYPTSHAHRHGQ